MDYIKIYDTLISKCLNRTFESGLLCEIHHILPRALGGGDDDSNLVKMYPREHFIAHKLLAKIHGGSMWFAVNLMSTSKYGRVNNKIYECEKLRIKEAQIGNKLEIWAKKKGFVNYMAQCEYFWESFVSGNTMLGIAKTHNSTEGTISRAIKTYMTTYGLSEQFNSILFSRRSEHSKEIRNNETNATKLQRITSIKNNPKARWQPQKSGGANPAARKVTFNGIKYSCVKELKLDTNLNSYQIRKRLLSPDELHFYGWNDEDIEKTFSEEE